MSDFENFINTVIIDKGDIDEARRRWNPEYKDQRTYDGDTVLHCACEYKSGDREGLVRLLVSLECDIEAQTDDYRRRPLHRCVLYDNREAMQALLDAGCSLSPRDRFRETPLMIADRLGHKECASLLRSSIKPNCCQTCCSKCCCDDRYERCYNRCYKLCSNFLCKYSVEVSTYLYKSTCQVIGHRLLQLLWLIVILCLMHKDGSWNDQEEGVSSVFTNVEGVDNLTQSWDIGEKDFFFIPTTVLVTNQTQEICVEYVRNGGTNCTTNYDCKAGKITKNGRNTGECDLSRQLCKIRAWCPTEDSNVTRTFKLDNIDNVTASIRVNVNFFQFNEFRTNYNFKQKPPPCIYDSEKSHLCPIFRVKDILEKINLDYKNIQDTGAVIGIFINWKCYFSWPSKSCDIKYNYKRLMKEENGEYAGYRYKSARYDMIQKTLIRTKITANGLRFVVFVGSNGYKFNFLLFLLGFGSLTSYLVTLGMIYFWIVRPSFTTLQEKIFIPDLVNEKTALTNESKETATTSFREPNA